MSIDPRRVAVAFAAIGAFLHLYAPQATLPLMAQEYGVGAADASKIITAGTHKASSIKVAEAAKVIENTQRDVNIALMNELSLIFL